MVEIALIAAAGYVCMAVLGFVVILPMLRAARAGDEQALRLPEPERRRRT
jgi:hypothetical protein